MNIMLNASIHNRNTIADLAMKNIQIFLHLQNVPKYQSMLASKLSEDAFDDCALDYYYLIVDILEQLSTQPTIASTGAWDILEEIN